MIHILILSFLYIILILHLLLMIAVLVGFFYKVPYVPSQKSNILKMLDLANIQAGEHVADLGCGDGKILFYAEKFSNGSSFTGYEIAPIPLILFFIRKFWFRSKVILIRKSFMESNLSKYNVLLLYLLPETLNALLPKFEKELPKGARIISNTFSFANKPPTQVLENENKKNKIFLYNF